MTMKSRAFTGSLVCLARKSLAEGLVQERFLPALTRNERHSLSRTDRARGVTKKRLGSRRLPFAETEWGLRRHRRKQIQAKAESEFLAFEEDRELREQKRQASSDLTANLPALTAADLDETYISLMAPSTSSHQLEHQSKRALARPLSESASILIDLHRRLLLPSPGPRGVATLAAQAADMDALVGALEHKLIELHEARAMLSPRAAEKQPLDAGLVTATEWDAMIRESARLAAPSLTRRILGLLQSSGPLVGTSMVQRACQYYTDLGDLTGAETVLRLSEEAGFPVDASVHHSVLSAHISIGDLVNAQFYLRAMEERGILPLESTYQLLIDHLFARDQPSAAWDLFAHCRAVAHPVPSEHMWARMIRACAPSRRYAATERALDLKQEMHDQKVSFGAESYTALITVCVKRGGAESYIKTLSLLREMINEGHSPDATLLELTLEAAAMEGDLARGRWIFAQLVAAAEAGDVSRGPSANALALLLQTHIKYPVDPPPQIKLAPSTSIENVAKEENKQQEIVLPLAPTEDADDDDVLRFPGPMPRTRGEVRSSADNLFRRYAEAFGMQVATLLPSEADANAYEKTLSSSAYIEKPNVSEDLGFSSMKADGRVLEAYFLVMRDVTPRIGLESALVDLWSYYRTAYARFGLTRHERAISLMLQACIQHRSHPRAAEIASSVFAEYAQTLGPGALKRRPEGGDSALAPYSRFTVRIWSSIINLLAVFDQLKAAMNLASQFAVLYPPSLITHFARAVVANQKCVPSPEISLATPDYAETSTFHTGTQRPPRLEFAHVKTLHQKLKEATAGEGIRWLTALVKQYTAAEQLAERIIRGNHALPAGDRGPFHLIGKEIPNPMKPTVLRGPTDDPLEPSRQRMLQNVDIQWEHAQHSPALPREPLGPWPLSAQRRPSMRVPPPPRQATVAAALLSQRAQQRTILAR